MYYTIYKITNQTNGKLYIGAHKTKNLNDGYMGSGKYLKRAIEKNGIENFIKEILFVFDTPEEMYEKEAELVNEEFLAEANTYNLKVGGSGGFDYINTNVLNGFSDRDTARRGRKLADASLEEKYGSDYRGVLSSLARNAYKKRYAEDPEFVASLSNQNFLGKKHTDETKRLIGEKNSKHQTGDKNSQFGTMWIYNPVLKKSMKISKQEPIPDGWFVGRKIKFE